MKKFKKINSDEMSMQKAIIETIKFIESDEGKYLLKNITTPFADKLKEARKIKHLDVTEPMTI